MKHFENTKNKWGMKMKLLDLTCIIWDLNFYFFFTKDLSNQEPSEEKITSTPHAQIKQGRRLSMNSQWA